MNRRLAEIEALVKRLGPVCVALSGGVDSGLLAAVAARALGEEAVGLTVTASVISARERTNARALAAQIGLRHEELAFDWLGHPGLAANPPERCYLCKRALYEAMRAWTQRHGEPTLLDGSNADDDPTDRPGMRALAEMGVRSPLRELGVTKEEVRALSRHLGLPGADQITGSCLATRFLTGTPIEEEALRQVERAEEALAALGFGPLRVRHHGTLARIELPKRDIKRAALQADPIVEALRRAGYRCASLDLEGYRSAERLCGDEGERT